MGNAIAQLADLVPCEIDVELRLPKQHDLQQLVLLGFQVGKQANLFEGGNGHALRFFHEDHHLPPLRMAPQQVLVKGVHHFKPGSLSRNGQLQLEADGVKDFLGRYARISQVDTFHMLGQARLQHPA